MQTMRERRGWVADTGRRVLWSFERLIERASTVPTTAVLSGGTLPWVAALEANWRAIRTEVDALLEHHGSLPSFQEISTDQVVITTDDRWKTYFLYGMGYRAEKNCARCPHTAELLESIPDLQTAFFSFLSPGKHIPAHRGVFKGLLRYHLGLRIPDNCRMRIDDQIVHWSEGSSILFDDTFEHEVWNDSDEIRVVLLIDVLRPVRFPVSTLNRSLVGVVKHTAYIQDARKNQEAWEQRFEAGLSAA